MAGVRKGKERARPPPVKPPSPSTTLKGWLASTHEPSRARRTQTPKPGGAKRRKIEAASPAPSFTAGPSRILRPSNCSPPPSAVVYDVDADEELAFIAEPDEEYTEVDMGDDFGPPRCRKWEDCDEPEVVLADEELGATMHCPICGYDLGMEEEKVAQVHVNRCIDLPSARLRFGVKDECESSAIKLERSPSLEARAFKEMGNQEEDFSLPVKTDCSLSETPVLKLGAPNAFTAIMNGHAEDKLWKEAAKNEREKGRRGVMRTAPFYKILEGMPLAVDAFRYGAIPGVKAYFLSHAHADHYTNLSHTWCHGPIYCSTTTANLIKMNLGVHEKWVKPMRFDEVIEVEGIRITMLDANHCPGSSLFLFEGPQRSPTSQWRNSDRVFRYLHTGDFRASPAHLEHPALKNKRLDIVYLDTTYCDPKHIFPAQEQVINACSELIRDRVLGDVGALRRGMGGDGTREKQETMMKGWLAGAKKEEDGVEMDGLLADAPEKKPERILVLIGTYSIGKERIVKGIARAIGSKVYCTDYKRKIFDCIDDPTLHDLLTRDALEAQVHVTNLFAITAESLANYLDSFKGHFTKIIGLRPTGWTFRATPGEEKVPSVAKVIATPLHRNYSPAYLYPQRDSTERCQAYGVPYSEHSSFRELTCFCVSVDCPRFIATVNVHSDASRAKMKSWFERWLQERKRRRDANEVALIPPRTPDYW